MVKNIWKSYIWTADKDVNESDPRSNMHCLGSSSSTGIAEVMGSNPVYYEFIKMDNKQKHSAEVNKIDSGSC